MGDTPTVHCQANMISLRPQGNFNPSQLTCEGNYQRGQTSQDSIVSEEAAVQVSSFRMLHKPKQAFLKAETVVPTRSRTTA